MRAIIVRAKRRTARISDWRDERGRPFSIPQLFFAKLAAMAAVEDVDHEAEAQPDHKAKPGDDGESSHESAAQEDRDERAPGNERHFEDALAIRLGAPQDDDSERNQHKGEERADVRQVGGVADGKNSRRHADRES